MAQLVRRLTLAFGSGPDLRVVGLSSVLSVEPVLDSLSLPLPLPLSTPACVHSLSLKNQTKQNQKL